MGSNSSSLLAGYDDMQRSLGDARTTVISTMPKSKQSCLIRGTVSAAEEEDVVNSLLKQNVGARIVVYGLNCTDGTPMLKKKQLLSLGFKDVRVYSGGLFEWLLLQEVFGNDAFPTDGSDLDIIKYGPGTRSTLALTNGV